MEIHNVFLLFLTTAILFFLIGEFSNWKKSNKIIKRLNYKIELLEIYLSKERNKK